MKLILYFSGTGNSMHLAQVLNHKLGDNEVKALLQTDAVEWALYDQLIISYPIYMNSLPAPVKRKLIDLNLPNGLSTIFLATHGGYEGVAGPNLVAFAEDHNINIEGYFPIKTVNNTPKGVAPKFLMQLEWEKDLEQACLKETLDVFNQQIDEVIRAIEQGHEGELEKARQDTKKTPFKIMNVANKLLGSKPAKLNFIVDDTCTGCGVCEKVCLTNRVKVLDSKAKWVKDECYYCYACFNFCPEQAIGVKHYTKKMGRYHYPDISFLDIAKQK